MIKLLNVSVALGDFSLKDINLEIAAGEFFSLLGPTGTGKTVLLELIAGFYQPRSGSIFIDGRDMKNTPPEKRGIGFVYQDYALFPHLDVYKNIAFGLKLKSFPQLEIENCISSLTEMLGISHLLRRYPGTLSGGEQQRVCLARALALSPKILLMDEPFSALDPNTKEMLYKELKRIHLKYKCTIVHITHDFQEADYLADRVGVILNGRVRQIGTPGEVFEKPWDQKVADFLGVPFSFTA